MGTKTARARVEERREAVREKVDIAARVRVLNPLLSTGPAALVHVEDRSDGGLRLSVPRQILVGSLVQVLMPGEILLCEVRSCSPTEDQYEIGVKIIESF